jgi:hypothetical protein
MALHPRLDWADDLLHRRLAQPRPQVLGEHLAVTGLPQHAAEPFELGGKPLRVLGAENPPERPERAAQPPAAPPSTRRWSRNCSCAARTTRLAG